VGVSGYLLDRGYFLVIAIFENLFARSCVLKAATSALSRGRADVGFSIGFQTESIAMLVTTTRWVGLLVCFSLAQGDAQAASPSLAFDFGQTAKCREVSPSDGGELYPGKKLVELKLRVSVQLLEGKITDVEEIRIEIGDCDRRIRVESFAPSTKLESTLSEDIIWTKTTESGKSLAASLGGEAPVPLGDVVAHVLPSISGGLSKREVIVEKQVRRAPQQVVVASGTIGQEHGVFFKLRPSPQSSLEGSHELTVRFLVPQNWRGDSLRVCCQATGHEKILWTTQPATWTHTCAPLAIYLAGDLEARTAAEKHVQKQSQDAASRS